MRGKGGVLTFTWLVCRASIGGINPKVRDLGRSNAAELFASEYIRKWGGIARTEVLIQVAKSGIIVFGFRGRGQRHCTVVSPHTH